MTPSAASGETGKSIGVDVAPSTPRSRFLQRAAMTLACLVLAIGLVLAVVPRLVSSPTITKREPLSAILLHPPPGWTTHEVPMADTPDGRMQVAQILQYDDAFAVRYESRSGTAVEIYAAYWSPGKAPYSLVGVHTPDTCWVVSGWQCLARTHRSTYEVEGRKLKPAELGTYSFDQTVSHVMFWHLVGGTPHEDFGMSGWRDGARGVFERFPLLFRDMRRYKFDLARDQVFVRISSATPIEQLLGERDFQELLRSLEPLGVFESKERS